ncbi:MAG: hypothetical protein FWD55_08640, partial [Propionibacteriaceae bacterium]|nr:hypothetical protein [Propionibacteriaceae bacterium]
VMDGLRGALDPESSVEEAEPWANEVTNLANRVLPQNLASLVPTQTKTLVRIHGFTQIMGAMMMATGVFRRLGAFIVAASYAPKVIQARSQHSRMSFTREVALLGGILIEAHDTQGKPSHAWRVRHKKRMRAIHQPKKTKEVKPATTQRRTEALRKALSSPA